VAATWADTATSGIWIILFGTISLECVRAPRGSTRRLFVADVPVVYYPLALYVLFAFMGQSFMLAQLLSMGLGYLIGFASSGEISHALSRNLERAVLISSSKTKEWEDSYLENLTSRPGWVVSNSATGSGAWSEDEESGMVRARRGSFERG
jgi:hypothetical protein